MAKLAELSHRHNATSAQISLAWMLAKNERPIPIPSSRKPQRLHENLASATMHLAPAEITELDALLDTLNIPVFGGHADK